MRGESCYSQHPGGGRAGRPQDGIRPLGSGAEGRDLQATLLPRSPVSRSLTTQLPVNQGRASACSLDPWNQRRRILNGQQAPRWRWASSVRVGPHAPIEIRQPKLTKIVTGGSRRQSRCAGPSQRRIRTGMEVDLLCLCGAQHPHILSDTCPDTPPPIMTIVMQPFTLEPCVSSDKMG